jgi:hypothetical protein
MYAGAAVSTVNLIILLALIGDSKVHHTVLGHHLTAAQASRVNTLFVTVTIAWSLAQIALWLWMAQANGQGRNWARSLATALFGLATLSLSSLFRQSVFHISFVLTAAGPIVPLLTWLAGLAVVWLLWRPASTAFFKPPGVTHAGHRA